MSPAYISLLSILLFTSCKPDKGKPALPVADTVVQQVKPAEPDSFLVHVTAGKWKGAFEETLLLKGDGTYEWQLDHENIACERGTFSHEGNKLMFTHKENCDASEGRDNLILGNAVCVCEQTHADAQFREVLSCESGGRKFQFGNAAQPTQAGDTVMIGSIACVVMGTNGTASQEVRLRSAASADSAVVEIEDMITGETRDKLKKGESFRILARTGKLYRIRDWENHWYYIHVNDLTGNAWVFGRYITEGE